MPKRTSRFSKRKTSLKSSVDPLAYSQPGVYVEEVSSLPRTIEGVPTSTTAFVGKATSGPFNEPTTLRSFGEFEIEFGGLSLDSFLGYSVKQFFENGGPRAIVVRIGTNEAVLGANNFNGPGALPNKEGLYALDKVVFSIY